MLDGWTLRGSNFVAMIVFYSVFVNIRVDGVDRKEDINRLELFNILTMEKKDGTDEEGGVKVDDETVEFNAATYLYFVVKDLHFLAIN